MVTDKTLQAINRLQGRALVVGIAGLVLTALGFLFGGLDIVFRTLLIGYVLCFGLVIGSMGLALIRHLAGGTWLIVVQRMAEAGMRTIGLFFVLGIVIFIFGAYYIFPWLDPAYIEKFPIVGEKLEYLNLSFFTARYFLYFAIWALVIFLLNSWSARLEATGNQLYAVNLRRFSAVGLILLVLTITFAATDWGMSLEPEWFSTIYGVHWAVNGGLTTLALVIITLTYLQNEPDFKHRVQTHHFHNLGNFVLAFVILWTYMSFAQFLIIWSGNIPEEIGYYLNRTSGLLVWVSIFLMLFHFLVPMIFLLFRRTKKQTPNLRRILFWILAVRVVDVYWVLAPSFPEARGEAGATLAAAYFVFTLTAVAGIGGLTLWMYLGQLKKRPLLPAQDPVAELYFAQESAHHHA